MTYTFYAAAGIFIATYVLISARRIGLVKVERPAAALLGAALMIVFGVVGPVGALQAIDLNVLVLLLGMMILVAGLEARGFFDYFSLRVAWRARTSPSSFCFSLASSS